MSLTIKNIEVSSETFTERPILFSGPMVRGILEKRKTQTRRTVKVPEYVPAAFSARWVGQGYASVDWVSELGMRFQVVRCPYGEPGDRLWVKETHGFVVGNGKKTVYRADGDPLRCDRSRIAGMKWRPSIFMNRHLSRIDLDVTGVRVEQLQDISEADAMAEGIERLPGDGPNRFTVGMHGHGGVLSFNAPTARGVYAMLWEAINGDGSWDANPFVWVIEFRRRP